MSSEEVEKKKNTRNVVILVVFLALAAGITALLINLFTEKSSYTSDGVQTTSAVSLYCTTKSKNIPEAFFDVSQADNASQTIKVIFNNKKIDSIFYNAVLIYPDNNKAIAAEATLNSAYGNYLQANGEDRNLFSPNFSVDGNEVKVSLYTDRDKLSSKLAKVFLIDTSETSLDSYSSKVLSTLYKTKGFSCEAKE